MSLPPTQPHFRKYGVAVPSHITRFVLTRTFSGNENPRRKRKVPVAIALKVRDTLCWTHFPEQPVINNGGAWV
jgi:hypothetical protein